MGLMTPEKEYLLLAKFDENNYANAFVLQFLVVTARHVATDGMEIQTGDGQESGYFSFTKSTAYDLAHSNQPVPSSGYELAPMPEIGMTVWAKGYHGPRREFFRIEAKIVAIAPNGRLTIQRISGKKFQAGMSGSPVMDHRHRVVGVLVAEANNSQGEMVFLEPATALIEKPSWQNI